jgi:hypothetical protein
MTFYSIGSAIEAIAATPPMPTLDGVVFLPWERHSARQRSRLGSPLCCRWNLVDNRRQLQLNRAACGHSVWCPHWLMMDVTYAPTPDIGFTERIPQFGAGSRAASGRECVNRRPSTCDSSYRSAGFITLHRQGHAELRRQIGLLTPRFAACRAGTGYSIRAATQRPWLGSDQL